jgi:deleted-in-malignant-brain-tumors protein 1
LVLADPDCVSDYFILAPGDQNCRCASSLTANVDCSQSGNWEDDSAVNLYRTLATLGVDGAERPVVRLVGGAAANIGRLELFHSYDGFGVWGTVCNDGFDDVAATVACRMLGYADGGEVHSAADVATYGSGTIQMDGISCSGDEVDLWACSHTTTQNCGHTEGTR